VRNTRQSLSVMLALVVATGVSLSADRIKLRSGKVIEGMFRGADSKSVRVLLDDGQVSEVPITDAVSVEFSPRRPAPHPAAKPAPKPAAAATPPPTSKVVTVPAGTPINVRLTQAIDVDSSQSGMAFKGRSGRSSDNRRLDRHTPRRVGHAASGQSRAVGQMVHEVATTSGIPEAARHGGGVSVL
jgi:hypothetical protein